MRFFLLYANFLFWMQMIIVWRTLRAYWFGRFWHNLSGCSLGTAVFVSPRWPKWESGDGLCSEAGCQPHSWQIMFYLEHCSACAVCYLPATWGAVPHDHQQAGLLVPEHPPSRPSSPNLPLLTPTSWLKFIPIQGHPVSQPDPLRSLGTPASLPLCSFRAVQGELGFFPFSPALSFKSTSTHCAFYGYFSSFQNTPIFFHDSSLHTLAVSTFLLPYWWFLLIGRSGCIDESDAMRAVGELHELLLS